MEPLECYDNPEIERITLQWAAQTGKTFFLQLCMASMLANDPGPGVFADMNEDSVIRVFERFWPLLDNIRCLKTQLPPPHLRKNTQIKTSAGLIHGAWSGSIAKAKDYGAKLIVKNEADGMVLESTRTESDFRLAIDDRKRGYLRFKIITCSTPSLVGQSYTEGQRLQGDNRAWMVPCPFCEHYQSWKTGNGKDPGGLRWERDSEGQHNALLAEKTAWYECESCRGRIEEKHRWQMSQRGLWVPEGCTVSQGERCGNAARPGRHATFGPLHSLASLMPGVSIGSIAKERVECLQAKIKSEATKHWMNSVEGRTFDPAPPTAEPNLIQKRMASEDLPGVCPEWTRFLTCGVDVSQMGPTDFLFHYWISAWGQGGRGSLVQLGLARGRSDLEKLLTNSLFPATGRLGRYRPSRCYIDSGDGDMTASIYQLCDKLSQCLPFPVTPIKGSSVQGKREEEGFAKNDAGLRLSKGAFRGEDKAWKRAIKERARRYDLILINTHLSQQWVEDRLQGRITPEDVSRYTMPEFYFAASPTQPFNLVRHITGDYLHEGKWLKRYKDQDLRDAWRYSAVGADQHTKDGREWDTVLDTIILEHGQGLAVNTFEGQRGIASGPDGRDFVGAYR